MGIFSFYLDGHKIAEAHNIITDRGKAVIGNYLSEERSSWANFLVIGSGQSQPLASDLSLDLEFWREPIDLKTYSFDQGELVVRGTIPGSVVGKIYEIGVYSSTSPTAVSSSGPTICYFDTSIEDWSAGADEVVEARVGSKSLKLTSPGSSSSSSFRFFGDLRSYNKDSIFKLGYLSSGATSSISVRIKSSSENYREYTFTPDNSSQYSVEEWSLSDFSIVGSANIFEFFDIEILIDGAGSVIFDVLSVLDQQLQDFSDVLVSRALVNSGPGFISKLPSRELQIEYSIDLSSGGSGE